MKTIAQAHSELKSVLSVRAQLSAMQLLEAAVMSVVDLAKDAQGDTPAVTTAVQSARTLLLEGSSEKDDPKYLIDCLESYMASAEAPTPAPAMAGRSAAPVTPTAPAAAQSAVPEAMTWEKGYDRMMAILQNSPDSIRAAQDLVEFAKACDKMPVPHVAMSEKAFCAIKAHQYLSTVKIHEELPDTVLMAAFDFLTRPGSKAPEAATPVVPTVPVKAALPTNLWCVVHEAFCTDRIGFITTIVQADSEQEAFEVFRRHQQTKQAYPHLWREAQAVKKLEVLK